MTTRRVRRARRGPPARSPAMRRGVRRTALAAALLLAAGGCGSAVEAPGPARLTGPGSWARAAEWPLASWWAVASAWTGREVVLLGSGPIFHPGEFGGPMDDYPTGDGAAAYDPVRDRWRKIRKPPFSLEHASLAALGDTVYAAALDLGPGPSPEPAGRFYALAPGTGTWRQLPDPPQSAGAPVGRIVAAGGRIVMAGRTNPEPDPVDLAYDPATRTWSRLAADPWGEADHRTLLGLPDGRLVAVSAPPHPASDRMPGPFDPPPPPRFWRAAVLDPGATGWRRLTPSPVVVGERDRLGEWVVAGGLVVNAADGSVPLYDKLSYTPKGRARDAVRATLPTPPTGGILDPDEGTWTFLPERPARPHPLGVGDPVGWIDASGGDLAILDGWAYDARRATWTELPPVPSAPDGLTSPVVAWTGERLLAWANARSVVTPDGHGSRTVVDNVGWAWMPTESAA